LFVNGKDLSGRDISITATSSTGATVKLAGGAFANKAKLPSAWFDITTQQVVVPAPTSAPTQSASPAPTPTLLAKP